MCVRGPAELATQLSASGRDCRGRALCPRKRAVLPTDQFQAKLAGEYCSMLASGGRLGEDRWRDPVA